jgi:hypothetical protein
MKKLQTYKDSRHKAHRHGKKHTSKTPKNHEVSFTGVAVEVAKTVKEKVSSGVETAREALSTTYHAAREIFEEDTVDTTTHKKSSKNSPHHHTRSTTTHKKSSPTSKSLSIKTRKKRSTRSSESTSK